MVKTFKEMVEAEVQRKLAAINEASDAIVAHMLANSTAPADTQTHEPPKRPRTSRAGMRYKYRPNDWVFLPARPKPYVAKRSRNGTRETQTYRIYSDTCALIAAGPARRHLITKILSERGFQTNAISCAMSRFLKEGVLKASEDHPEEFGKMYSLAKASK